MRCREYDGLHEKAIVELVLGEAVDGDCVRA